MLVFDDKVLPPRHYIAPVKPFGLPAPPVSYIMQLGPGRYCPPQPSIWMYAALEPTTGSVGAEYDVLHPASPAPDSPMDKEEDKVPLYLLPCDVQAPFLPPLLAPPVPSPPPPRHSPASARSNLRRCRTSPHILAMCRPTEETGLASKHHHPAVLYLLIEGEDDPARPAVGGAMVLAPIRTLPGTAGLDIDLPVPVVVATSLTAIPLHCTDLKFCGKVLLHGMFLLWSQDPNGSGLLCVTYGALLTALRNTHSLKNAWCCVLLCICQLLVPAGLLSSHA